MKIVVIGSGGREHAIAWSLAKSPLVSEVVCIPGNGGTSTESKCRNIDPKLCEYTNTLNNNEAIVKIAKTEKCDFVVIGPENPLAEGLADKLWAVGIPVVGPKSQGAALEASKDLSKNFMHKYGVACAESSTFTDAESAHEYVDQKGAPIVIKADGLAAGKGVVVAATTVAAHKAIDDFMLTGTLGDAGNKLVIEEYLKGTEISILAAVSVTAQSTASNTACIIPFMPARDHKRLKDGAKGPNTGGMGAIAPLSDVTSEQLEQFHTSILEPTLRGLIGEKMDYRGFIFFGIMLTDNGPKLLEYNVRLGDPETQAVLPLMDFDFAAMCKSIIDGSLNKFTFKWKPGFVCAPVAVSGGYPAKYKKGCPIHIDTLALEQTGAKLFIAGAIKERRQHRNTNQLTSNENILVTNGGRVLAVSAYGETFEQSRENAYKAMNAITFTDMFYRKDIGMPGAASSGDL